MAITIEEDQSLPQSTIALDLEWVLPSTTGRTQGKSLSQVRRHAKLHAHKKGQQPKGFRSQKREALLRPRTTQSWISFDDKIVTHARQVDPFPRFRQSDCQALWLFPSSLDAPPNAPELISHLFETLAPCMYEMNDRLPRYRSSLWRLGTTGPMAFKIVLCSAATHLARLHGEEFSVQSAILKAQAFKQIRSRLASSETAISDESIAAVLAIAAHEHLFGDLEAFQTHMAAIEHMVNLRGGLYALSTNKTLQALICWTDINVCCIFGRTPRFPVPEDTRFLFDSSKIDDSLRSTLAHHGVRPALKSTLTDLQSFATEVRTTSISHMLEVDWVNTRLKINSLLHGVLIARVTEFDGWSLAYDAFHESCRLAALMYICLLFNTYQKFPVLHNANNPSKLKEYLLVTEKLWRSELKELGLWVLFIAASTCSQTLEWNWFSEQIHRRLTSMGLLQWEQTQHILGRFWWSGAYCDRRFFNVWCQVMQTETFLVTT